VAHDTAQTGMTQNDPDKTVHRDRPECVTL
jgi:hypothetical protein